MSAFFEFNSLHRGNQRYEMQFTRAQPNHARMYFRVAYLRKLNYPMQDLKVKEWNRRRVDLTFLGASLTYSIVEDDGTGAHSISRVSFDFDLDNANLD